MKKSGLIILVIIGVIVLGIALGMSGKPEDKTNTSKTNTQATNTSVNNKNVETNTISNTVNEQNENVIANEENKTETFNEEPKTESQKAIDIVKLDWKEDKDNVSFAVDGVNNDGKYIISVRDKNTKALAFYTVNVSDGTFTKKEMN